MADTAQTAPARLESAVVLRTLATVLVIVVHTTHWPKASVVYDDLDALSRLAVPAFMVLTGVLLSYRQGDDTLDAAEFLGRRLSRSLLPWLAWAPFYTLTAWFVTGDTTHDLSGVVGFLSYGAGHLWYLLLIPQMYVVYLVWPRRRLWWWAGAAMLVQTVLCVYRLYGPMPVEAMNQFFLWHGFQLLPFWIGYFAVGVAAGQALDGRGEPQRIHWGAVAAVAAVAAISGVAIIAIKYTSAPHGGFATGTGGFLLPQEPLFVVSVAVLVWLTGATLMRHGGALASVTRLLSRYSLGIYILHPIVIYGIASALPVILNVALPLSLVGFVVITVSGLAVAAVLSLLLSATSLAPAIGASRRSLPWRGGSRAVPNPSSG